MKIPDSVLSLINDEQQRQQGEFIPQDPGYLEKLSQNAELLIHQDPSGILGFVFFYCNAPDKNVSYITLICTSILARGKGIGHDLLKHVLELSRNRGFSHCQLEVKKDNTRALNFYQKAGFVCIEDRNSKFLMSLKLN